MRHYSKQFSKVRAAYNLFNAGRRKGPTECQFALPFDLGGASAFNTEDRLAKLQKLLNSSIVDCGWPTATAEPDYARLGLQFNVKQGCSNMAVIMALGLDHVVLRVKDVPLACAWYAAVLGCKVERVLPSLGLTQLRAGASLIDLIDVKSPAGKSGGAAPGAKRRNMDHFCVQLAEFSEKKIVAHLKRKGIKAGTIGRRYGALGHGPSLYLTDPDGNTVELKGPPDADQTEKVPDAIWPGRRGGKAR